MKKKLVLVTAHFPYGSSETFLESELPILAKNFEQIEILTFLVKGEKRKIPANCTVTDISIKESNFMAYLGIFSVLFWKEIFTIKLIYRKKISLGILKTMLISLMRAKNIASFINLKIQNKQDHIYYSYWCDDSALALAILNKENNKLLKTVTRSHGWDVYFEVSDYNYLPFRHFIHEQLSQIFPISEKGKKYMEEIWKVQGKITVSRLGTSSPPLEGEQGGGHLFNSIKKSDVFTIVSCSNLIPLKRVPLIIEALSLIENKSIHWIHFGDGPEEQFLKELAHKKLKHNITYNFKGRIANIEVLEFYKINTPQVFINVSSSEGIPVSIMEAMSFGIPCIGTDVGGNGEIIVDSSNGILLQSNPNIIDVKNAILEITSKTPEQYIEISKNAFQTWKNLYNSETNYTNFTKLIR